MVTHYYQRHRFCGCWIPVETRPYSPVERRYLPQVDLNSSTTILATTSRTTLKQTFVNDQDKKLDEVQYTFPLYDGVSVVGFTCTVGPKTIVGIVKEKQEASVEYQAAVARGETAGLLEQLPEASDVFTTSIGNVPANEKVHVEIVYLGELKHDAETDGSRFTIPTIIAPRYGAVSGESESTLFNSASKKGRISISVDVTLEDGTIVRGLQSPSHPIAVTMGRTSKMDEDAFSNNHASATLTLGSAELDKDFVVVVLAKGTDTPRALLETHPTIPNQRAIMTTLVPKFNLPNISPEIVFVVDRSGSMEGKIELVVSAMKIFLKSLPIGVKFNICSFGSTHSFLFKRSKTYDQSSLKEALSHLNTFAANYGGTEMLQPVKATVENRFKDLPLEVMLLTDGEIWNQEELFTFINETSNARFFTLGIGHGASSALVEGIARAGNGFAQFVGDNEKMDRRVVRMLKGALTPHITDYTLEVTYGQGASPSGDDDFEMVDSASTETLTVRSVASIFQEPEQKKPISLFDTNATEDPPNPPAGRYDNLINVTAPKILQAPHKIPTLYPFNRTTVYLLLGSDAPRKDPKSVTLRGTSQHGPLELEIPIQDVGTGETLHQLAAKKAVHELEHGRGWITEARDGNGKLIKTAHEGKWDLIVEREAVRLGVLFQVGGKWCSFVAVDKENQQEHKPTRTDTGSASETVSKRRGISSQPPGRALFSGYAASQPVSNQQFGGGSSSGFGLLSVGGAGAARGGGSARVSRISRGRAVAAPPVAMQMKAAAAFPGSAPAPASAAQLEQYQSGLMTLHQENKDRKRMVAHSQAQPPPPPVIPGSNSLFGSPSPAFHHHYSSTPQQDSSGSASPAVSAPAAAASVAKKKKGGSRPHGMGFFHGFSRSREHGNSDEGGEHSEEEDVQTLADTEKMHKIIALQEFDGSWQVSDKLLELLGVSADQFTGLDVGISSAVGNKTHRATALAIAWLKVKVPTEEDVWEMVVDKAMGWLSAQTEDGNAEEAVKLAGKVF
ncbi:von Willebrand factor type A domain containing protein [Cladophialophora carrionii]|uniref:von Willebrand factor type A domain containing protein n=1 Tax=Cladophialophora carrionii TaxID=86049 RepID=A0A1C1CCM0_9EURO|nr:von Willebrand factor type A domain containing protein [Cladophialophora carrionii]